MRWPKVVICFWLFFYKFSFFFNAFEFSFIAALHFFSFLFFGELQLAGLGTCRGDTTGAVADDQNFYGLCRRCEARADWRCRCCTTNTYKSILFRRGRGAKGRTNDTDGKINSAGSFLNKTAINCVCIVELERTIIWSPLILLRDGIFIFGN